MPRSRSVVDLIGLAYDSAVGAVPWEAFLASAAEILELDEVTVEDLDLATISGRIRWQHGLDPGGQRSYDDHFVAVNPFARAVDVSAIQPGFVGPTHALCSDRTLEASEYFQGWLKPQGLYYGVGGTIRKEGATVVAFTGMRARVHGPVGEKKVQLLEWILGHLGRALDVESRFFHAESERSAAVGALERLTAGVVLVTGRHRVAYANPAANSILGERDGIYLAADGLRAERPADTTSLRSCIRSVTEAWQPGGPPGGGTVLLPRRHPRGPLRAIVSSLGRDGGAFGWSEARGLVLLEDPERELPSNLELLQRLFRLTPAEAAVADRLMRGDGLVEAGEALAISRNTAKSHFRNIARKTRVRRQVDLVRLLTSSLGTLRFD